MEQTPGLKTNVIVERVFEKQLPKPYSSCLVDNEAPKQFYSKLYDLILNSPYEYNQQFCFDLCQQETIYQECGCIGSDKYSFYPNYAVCASNISCMTQLNKKFASNDFLIANCLSLCPLQCNRTLYRTSISSTLLLGDSYVGVIKNRPPIAEDFVTQSVNVSQAQISVVRVYIFYEYLAYTESAERAVSTSILTLASIIGGLLSLFLGVSVLSLFELIEVFLEIYFVQKF